MSIFTISSFKSIENTHDVCTSKDCIKKFWESLREHAKKIINFKKKKIKLLTNEQQKKKNEKNCYICKDKFEDKYAIDKKYCKFRDRCHCTDENRGTA